MMQWCKTVSKHTMAAVGKVFWFLTLQWSLISAYCLFCKSGNPDECQLAAEIYQCGRDVAPAITTEIFTRSKGNATVVSFIIIKYLICVTAGWTKIELIQLIPAIFWFNCWKIYWLLYKFVWFDLRIVYPCVSTLQCASKGFLYFHLVFIFIFLLSCFDFLVGPLAFVIVLDATKQNLVFKNKLFQSVST
jgi:hypothetical protein